MIPKHLINTFENNKHLLTKRSHRLGHYSLTRTSTGLYVVAPLKLIQKHNCHIFLIGLDKGGNHKIHWHDKTYLSFITDINLNILQASNVIESLGVNTLEELAEVSDEMYQFHKNLHDQITTLALI